MRRALFDVVFLVALLDQDHHFHQSARRWFEANIDGGWASCPLTQNGFTRIVSQPSYPANFLVKDAVLRLEQATSTTYHEFWPDSVSITDSGLILPERIHGPKQLTDLYLLALAVRNEGRLVTFDRSIPLSPIQGATEDHLYCL